MAYDLNQFKTLSAVDRAKLTHQGLIAMQAGCGCGKRIVDEGVQLLGCEIETLPGNQVNIAYAAAVFCSTGCRLYVEARLNGLPYRPADGSEPKLTPVLAERALPEINWL